jgi:hypothetical protein
MRTPTVLALAATLLSACATTASSPAVCPEVVAYSAADQDKANAELKALPPGAILGRFIADYGRLRDDARACQGVKKAAK